MATRSSSLRTRSEPVPGRARSRPRGRAGGRLWFLLGAAVTLALVAAAVSPFFDKAVQEITLPLRHEDIIRQQARDKGLDPALIAGVIYTESRFRDQTSPAGAKGLMQILPSTADYIASKSGGTEFVQGDLASPQINIAYGSFYLRYLLDRYDGNELLALAAYNGGEGRVDAWRARAAARGEAFRAADHIPFPETRDYVQRVLEARAGYRREYRRELGL
ncbi:MAG: lytic transglycosylase domain-containing protein [Actinomycetota bacterium]|nr:lytic transglycosylase domain-containing protein [Actinomycetota bacterium]